MRIYTYARFSTDRQDEASIKDQQRVCHDFAAKRHSSTRRQRSIFDAVGRQRELAEDILLAPIREQLLARQR
jgi:DNA invertase Pin-like site-specific DNA recombinase